MVSYLCRSGILAPSLNATRGRGIVREFSYADLLLVRAVATLLRSGVSVKVLKGVLETLKKKIDRELAKNPARALSKTYVSIIDQQVYLRESGAVVQLSANGQLAFHFVLDADGAPARKLTTTQQRRIAGRRSL
ncbi:MAG TPA: hypothetical protein VM074_11730 [Solimonas sp.]|nr:hypothetical protein [Solimonas sp.]